MSAGAILVCTKTGKSGINNLYSGISEELWKWSKEAEYYTQTPKGVKCLLCPNECSIKEGELGDCHSRLNYKGKLYSIAYGNPCAVNIDPIEKKPLYHFLPKTKSYSIATAGCNLSCLNCQNWTISQVGPRETKNYDLMPEKVVQETLKNKCRSISYTYSEPITFYEYMRDTAKSARLAGIKNVMVTAGYINEKPLRQICKVIDAANVDVKSFSNDIYMKLNAGTLDPVLNTLKIMADENIWLEIGNLIVPGWTDDFDMIKRFCDWIYKNNLHTYPLHFLRFYPQYKLSQLAPTPVNTLLKAKEIALAAGIQFVYLGNVTGAEAQNTYCPSCKKLLVERKGYEITQNHIINGCCEYCKKKIPGVWN